MNQLEHNDLCGKVLLEEHQTARELEAYRVKIEKNAEALAAVASGLRRFVDALDPKGQLTEEAGRHACWAPVDLAQASEDCHKAMLLRQRLDTLRVQKTRLDL